MTLKSTHNNLLDSSFLSSEMDLSFSQTDPTPSSTVQEGVFSPGDPIFFRDGLIPENEYLRVRGSAVSLPDANAQVERVIAVFQINIEQLHGAQLVHGSTSASLLSFTKYGDRSGCLFPLKELETLDKVSFCGELRFGSRKNGVNQSCLSTVWIGELEVTIPYTQQQGWTPDTPVKIRDDSPDDMFEFQQKIQSARQSAWQQLDPIEQNLVADPFPVIYGIKSERIDSHKQVQSDIPGEIGLLDGALKEEIKVVFVPESKTTFLKDLLSRYGHLDIFVEPFNFLT